MHSSVLDTIQSLVLIATLVAVIFYTIETAKLRKEAHKQNDILLRPLIMPFASNPIYSYALTLKNIGKGSAFNIAIETDEDPIDKHSWAHDRTFLAPEEEDRWDSLEIVADETTKNSDNHPRFL